MKKTKLTIKTIIISCLLLSCEQEVLETVDPNEANDTCKCGTITNINQYYPDTFFTYTLSNECTGNDTTTTNEQYYDYGLTMCLDKSW